MKKLRRRRRSTSVAAAIAQFAITGTLAVVLLGFLAVTLLRNTGTSEAIRDAKQTARLAGDGIVAPAVTPALERGDPKAIAAMDRLVRRALLRDPVVRVKLWDTHGRIVYSDEHRLIGQRYSIGHDELYSLRHRSADAEVSDLTRPENRFERVHHKLLEVYLGIRPQHGPPLLFESYQRFSSISASGRRLWERFLPALIIALVLLELAQIPLAFSLARRLRKGQAEREGLLQRALDASELERRRIAGELHDGVVQRLAGVSFGLSAAAEGMPPGSAERAAVEDAAGETRRSVRELRSLLVDIYPPALEHSGLEAALADVLTRDGHDGPATRLFVDPDLDLGPEAEALIFRGAQEALRNVRKHAEANAVQVTVCRDDGHAVLEVADDGRGIDPTESRGREGHFGLRMLHDLALDAGGRFAVEPREEGGTRVRLEVPLQ